MDPFQRLPAGIGSKKTLKTPTCFKICQSQHISKSAKVNIESLDITIFRICCTKMDFMLNADVKNEFLNFFQVIMELLLQRKNMHLR